MVKRLLDERGRAARLALAVTMGAIAVALFAAPAQANFTSGKCDGSNITGRGATFANSAHQAWINGFTTYYCPGGPTVTYEAQGSGAGRRVVGERTGTNSDGSQSRNQVPRFGMSDEPPSPTGQGQMNTGTDSAGDEGLIHVIPAASGAVVLAVNFPNNCDRSLLPNSAETDPGAPNSSPFVDRVRFTRAQFEAVWAGDNTSDEWTEVFPTLAGDIDCDKDITRVVRFDDSGTTFTWKDYLHHLNPGRGWLTTYTTPDTRNWPDGPGVGPRADCGGANGPQGDKLTSACANGNGPLVQKLLTTDGGVGYSDIATARANGYAITPAAVIGSRDDDIFWTQAPNPSGSQIEPTDDPNGFRTDGQKGSDCDPVTFTGLPASTTGNWANVSGVDSANGFVVCTLTYGLKFDDDEPPYSLQGSGFASEELKARTVKDYWTFILTETGQNLMPPADYDRLPASILALARTGVGVECFDKAGTGPCPTPTGAGPIYARPGSASPMRVSLVPTYTPCTSPNSTHVAPLSIPSCTTVSVNSTQLTTGTGGAMAAFARYTVLVGDSATIADEQDVGIQANITDVKKKSDLTDYVGQVILTSQIRVTDLSNGDYEATTGTTQDTELSFPMGCTATGGAAGSTCALATTADTMVPNLAKEGRRAIIAMLGVKVEDAGPNGTLGPGCPRICGDGDETEYLSQGVFQP